MINLIYPILLVVSNLAILFIILRHQAKHTIVGKPAEILKLELENNMKLAEIERIKMQIRQLEHEAKLVKLRLPTKEEELEALLEPHEG